MEKNSLNNMLNLHSHQHLGHENHIHCDRKNRPRDSRRYNSEKLCEDHLGGLFWPPRSYTCSFCKKEFRSAQALGGHMNVHRRDRARLRQSPPGDDQPPFLSLNLNPIPKHNYSTHVAAPRPHALPYMVSSSPSLLSSSSLHVSHTDENKRLMNPSTSNCSNVIKCQTQKLCFGSEHAEECPERKGCCFLKKTGIVRLDLDIGILSESKQELDLELRLGYS